MATGTGVERGMKSRHRPQHTGIGIDELLVKSSSYGWHRSAPAPSMFSIAANPWPA